MIKLIETDLPEVLIIDTEVYSDDRGFFLESYNIAAFQEVGLPTNFVQDNHSRSAQGVLRGLHYQHPQWQGKLVRAVVGKVFDVAVDIRRASPSFGKWTGVALTAENHRQLYIPPGFAHGFCVLSAVAELIYKCTQTYKPSDEAGILWNDPDIGIKWPIQNPILATKDKKARLLAEIPDLTN